MESFTGQHESLKNPEAMVARVLTDAKRTYNDVADSSVLERCAHRAVFELWTDSCTVTSFIPVLAMRHIREMLDEQGRDRNGSG
jgi:hypothetical protein